jgi:hypothetical protein
MKNLIKYIVYLGIRAYFSIRHWIPVWRLLNWRGVLLKKKFTLMPTETVSKRIADELKRNGIAVSSVDELFPGENLAEKLAKYALEERVKAEKKLGYNKKFLEYLWDYVPRLDAGNPFLRTVLDRKPVTIISEYLGCLPKFYQYTLNVTLPVSEGASPQKSQKWHRDPEDKRMCKVFIYLTDVDESAGPFIYVLGSQYGGKWRRISPQKPPLGAHVFEEEVGSIPEKCIMPATGKAGTVIFCDTTGIHRGGYATAKERIMFTGAFVSRACPGQTWYTAPPEFEHALLSASPYLRDVLRQNPPPLGGYIFRRTIKLIKWGNHGGHS